MGSIFLLAEPSLSPGNRAEGRRSGWETRLFVEEPMLSTGLHFASESTIRRNLDLMISGSFWMGAALGALVAVALLNPSLVDPGLGWRLAFLTGAAIGLVVFAMRMWIPESPRWLAIHGREAEGEAAVAAIEKRFIEAGVDLAPVPESAVIWLRSRTHTPLREVFDTLFNRYRLRTFVGLTLMAAQAFFYNAIF